MSEATAVLADEAAAAWRRVVRLCDAVPDGRMDKRSIEAERRADALKREANRLRRETA